MGCEVRGGSERDQWFLSGAGSDSLTARRPGRLPSVGIQDPKSIPVEGRGPLAEQEQAPVDPRPTRLPEEAISVSVRCHGAILQARVPGAGWASCGEGAG